MRDIMYIIAFMLLLVAGFYAFQLLVILIVGYVVWLALPFLHSLSQAFRS